LSQSFILQKYKAELCERDLHVELFELADVLLHKYEMDIFLDLWCLQVQLLLLCKFKHCWCSLTVVISVGKPQCDKKHILF